jgi:hypothetical protein
MIDPDWIEHCLKEIVASTPGERISGGFWVGDVAAERRASDNLRSGRIYWHQSRESALRGLDALKRGDMDYAELAWRSALALRAAANEAQLKPSQFALLQRDAGARGRTADQTRRTRDELLAAEVDKQEAKGLKGHHARAAAIAANPELSRAFREISPAGIRAALKKGRLKKV